MGQLAESSALHLDLGVAVELTAEVGLWPGAWINVAGALAGSGQEPSWLLVVRPPQQDTELSTPLPGMPGRPSLSQSSEIRASASAALGGGAPK